MISNTLSGKHAGASLVGLDGSSALHSMRRGGESWSVAARLDGFPVEGRGHRGVDGSSRRGPFEGDLIFAEQLAVAACPGAMDGQAMRRGSVTSRGFAEVERSAPCEESGAIDFTEKRR